MKISDKHSMVSPSSTALAEPVETIAFDFDGDPLDVVRLPDGDVGVSLRHLSEAIGINYSGQLQRLRRWAATGVSWATVCIMHTVAGDGKPRSMAVLHRRAIPMWAATIDLGRLRGHVRRESVAKLVRYQDRCAEILADHFLGPRVVSAHALLVEREALMARVELLEDVTSPGIIGRTRAQTWILGPLREAARIRCALDGGCSDAAFLRVFRDEEHRLRRTVRYAAGLGRTWAALPLDRYGEAVAEAFAIKGRAERDWHRAQRAELDRVKAGAPLKAA
jgi:hypothetical protein